MKGKKAGVEPLARNERLRRPFQRLASGRKPQPARLACATGAAPRPRFKSKENRKNKMKKKGKYARSVDIKKHYEIMTQLLLQLSCCASSKKSDPDLQRSFKSFSFDFSTPAQTNPTGYGINTSR